MISSLSRQSFVRTFVIIFITVISCVQCSKTNEQATSIPFSVVPRPADVKNGDGSFIIDSNTSIHLVGDGDAAGIAGYLADMISAASSFKMEIKNTAPTGRAIVMQLSGSGNPESYSLNVTADQIQISAPAASGLFHAVQTLRQLLPPSIETKNKAIATWKIPAVSIHDDPAYKWRGMHLDVSRHFFSVAFVKQFIDRLALYKFNRLHLHLTDDQGWRLQINKYPQLTDKGAWRQLNNQDSACLKKAITNSDFALPEEFFADKNGVKMYGGYYSQDDIREIVKYASDRFVEIIPEIDMPGHMNAAVSSFPELTCVDEGGWGKLFTIPLCPCEETTYEFIGNVLSEVAPLFPGEYIHIGADEVDESSWLKSSACRALMKEHGWKSSKDLHSYFVNRVNKIVNGLGKKTIGWDEIIEGNPDTSVTVMYWRGWVPNAPALAASRGHDVIMSPTSHCYFDYEPTGKTLEQLYAFNPVPADVTASDRKKIIGLQANIWTEVIPTPARLDYMTMPRMAALAEVGWSREKAWDDYSSRVMQHYPRWDVMKIKYRLPDIPDLQKHVVFIDSARLDIKIPDGVTEIRYTLDGTEPDTTSKKYTMPLRVDSSITVKLLTLGYHNRPGNRNTIRFEKQNYLQAVFPSVPLKNGLQCRYFEGSYSSVSKIATSDLKKEVIVNTIDKPAFCSASVFALVFDGLIEIPEEGVYTFYLSSDDGSTLEIGNRLVVNNDGYHSDREESGQVALAKGLHPFSLKYFEGGGGGSLSSMMEGPGMKKQYLPHAMLKFAGAKK